MIKKNYVGNLVQLLIVTWNQLTWSPNTFPYYLYPLSK